MINIVVQGPDKSGKGHINAAMHVVTSVQTIGNRKAISIVKTVEATPMQT